MLDETRNRLIEWARWVRSGGINNGYAQVCLITPSGGCDVQDDAALQVDRAVATLKRRDRQMGQALVNYYVRGWDYSMVGLEFRVSREKARNIVRMAEAWVDSSIFMLNQVE
ncbi:MAG: antiterminator Q family protein [Marinobacter sp.]|nr:antiterminator Q family protein [Marinobacter sp.]